MVGTLQGCAKFIKLAKKYDLRALFANASFVGSANLAKELGDDDDGVVITQIAPHWSDAKEPAELDRAAPQHAERGKKAAELHAQLRRS